MHNKANNNYLHTMIFDNSSACNKPTKNKIGINDNEYLSMINSSLICVLIVSPICHFVTLLSHNRHINRKVKYLQIFKQERSSGLNHF